MGTSISKTIWLLLAERASSRMKTDKALLKIGIPDIISMKGSLISVHLSFHSGNVKEVIGY